MDYGVIIMDYCLFISCIIRLSLVGASEVGVTKSQFSRLILPVWAQQRVVSPVVSVALNFCMYQSFIVESDLIEYSAKVNIFLKPQGAESIAGSGYSSS